MGQVHLAAPEIMLILVGERETCDMQPAEPLQTSSGRKMNLSKHSRQQHHRNGCWGCQGCPAVGRSQLWLCHLTEIEVTCPQL